MDEIIVEDISVENIPKDELPPVSAAPAIKTNPVEHLAISQHFRVDMPNKQEDGMLKEVWEHGKALSKTQEITDVIWQIMHVESILGAPKLGESRLDRIYRYSKLKRQEQMIQDQLHNV
jgi:hypothetical protein